MAVGTAGLGRMRNGRVGWKAVNLLSDPTAWKQLSSLIPSPRAIGTLKPRFRRRWPFRQYLLNLRVTSSGLATV